MRKNIHSLIALGCLFASSTALAGNASFQAFEVTRESDLQMSCEEIIKESLLMREIIQSTEDTKSEARFNSHAVTAAAGVGSFLVGTLTAGVGIAAAGFVASQEVSNDKQSAEDLQNIAHQRRALLKGIYKSKDCTPDPRMDRAWQKINKKSAIQAGLDSKPSPSQSSSTPQNSAHKNQKSTPKKYVRGNAYTARPTPQTTPQIAQKNNPTTLSATINNQKHYNE